ncbi:hypothetical protein DFJ74DRAFT_131663 [Hyaloraphidium curvatum]|nr:hypothetical protein DFJ74DRAFT_131663 [Hyaloraphidium curvatum]
MSVSAADFSKSDEQLKADAAFQASLAKYSAVPSDDLIAKAKAALEAKKHHVHVVADGKAALEAIKGLIPAGSKIGMGYSTTLVQIGFIDFLKENPELYDNTKGKAVEAQSKGDWAGYAKYIAEGASAAFFLSSANSVTAAEGNIHGCDLTGTRINGWTLAGNVVIVVGANKIVADDAEAEKRLAEYTYPLESARVRVAYGVPASAINNKVGILGENPFGAPRFHVVIIKESLGF